MAREGCVRVRKLVTRAQVKAILTAFDGCKTTDISGNVAMRELRVEEIKSGDDISQVFSRINDRVSSLRLGREPYELRSAAVLSCKPQDGLQVPHLDQSNPALVVLVLLTDGQMTNMMDIPYDPSKTTMSQYYIAKPGDPSMAFQLGISGDATFLNGDRYHQGPMNETNIIRMVLFLMFAPNWPGRIKPDYNLQLQVRYILGDIHIHGTHVIWFRSAVVDYSTTVKETTSSPSLAMCPSLLFGWT